MQKSEHQINSLPIASADARVRAYEPYADVPYRKRAKHLEVNQRVGTKFPLQVETNCQEDGTESFAQRAIATLCLAPLGTCGTIANN